MRMSEPRQDMEEAVNSLSYTQIVKRYLSEYKLRPRGMHAPGLRWSAFLESHLASLGIPSHDVRVELSPEPFARAGHPPHVALVLEIPEHPLDRDVVQAVAFSCAVEVNH